MTRTVLSLGNFFGAAQLFFIVYALGPYLALYLPAEETGLVIASSAILTLILFPLMPRLVARHGARRLAVITASAEAAGLLWLSAEPSAAAAIFLVAAVCALPSLITYELDLMLEATVDEESRTGGIRTAFLTAGNIAIVIAPLIAGILIALEGSYRIAFFVSAIALIPFIGLFLFARMPAGEAPDTADMRETFIRLYRNRDLRNVSVAYFVLQSFYQWTRLYIPLYLHTALGVPWETLGFILAVSLVPFVLVEYPVGIIADRYWGDKEFLFIGFLVTGIAYALISFVTADSSIPFMLGIMVAMNIGAAIAEAATEGHFFRRVSSRDANTVGVFRMARPLATLVAPVVGSLLLAILGYGTLFLVSGAAIAVVGSLAALGIKDAR